MLLSSLQNTELKFAFTILLTSHISSPPAGNHTVTALADIYIEAAQLFEAEMSTIRNLIVGVLIKVQANLELKTYSNCLVPFKQLKALERFDMTPELNMEGVILRSHLSFLDCITADCEGAGRQIEENIPGCPDNFCGTVQRVLGVTSTPAFNTLVVLERVTLAVDALLSQAVLVCERVRMDYQLSSSSCNDDLFSKLKINVAYLDLLRVDVIVSRATAESYHSLIASVKSTVELCFKQASKIVSAIATGQKSSSDTAAVGWLRLEGLILKIHEASTFNGGLQDAYNGELGDLIAEMSAVTEVLTDHFLKGEDGGVISYKSHNSLKSLWSKKCSVAQLGEVLDNDCVDRVPELREVSSMITDSITYCNNAVAAAATQGTEIMLRF
jgi:hypothetical protein